MLSTWFEWGNALRAYILKLYKGGKPFLFRYMYYDAHGNKSVKCYV